MGLKEKAFYIAEPDEEEDQYCMAKIKVIKIEYVDEAVAELKNKIVNDDSILFENEESLDAVLKYIEEELLGK